MFLLKRNPFSILLRGLSQSQHVPGEHHQRFKPEYIKTQSQSEHENSIERDHH